MLRISILAVVMLLPAWAAGAEVLLLERATLGGAVVRLGDIATITSTLEGEAEKLAALVLLPSPAAGTQPYLTAAQVRDLLAASAVDLETVQIGGSGLVALQKSTTNEPTSAPRLSADGTARPELDRDAAAEHLSKLIVAYLHEQTSHDLWTVTVSADTKLVDFVSRTLEPIEVSGGKAPWTGRQRFELAVGGVASGVRAFASVERLELIAFATRDIAAGDFIRASDVTLEARAGRLPSAAVTSMDSVVGQEAKQTIRAGVPITANQIRSPLLVRRGERVQVRARAGTIVVRTYATAQQDGSLGDLVQVQSLEGKERYAARVAGVRDLEVYASGASADDLADVRQTTTR